ncbi:MAG: LCP family protein [Bacillota bacterium]|jgi:LCP family protein required for cell wall assembly
MGKKISKKKKVRRKRIIKVIVIALIILAVLCAGAFGAVYYILGNLNTVDITKDDSELGIDADRADRSDDKITNIALFGVDTRDMSKDSGRSDAIMVLTIDEKGNAIKMTSILRDSKVAIEGHGEEKITHAYAYGGPTLAIKTINQNFDMDIKDYITVNFSQLAEIVDSVGGITMDVTAQEVAQINKNAADGSVLTGSGKLELNGAQAVSYTRIRKIDSDNARADRQQKVLNAVFQKLAKMPKTEYPGVIRQFLGIVETSLDYGDIIGYTTSSLIRKGFYTEQYTIPDSRYETDLWGGIDSGGAWVWVYNLDNAAARLHQIVYGEDGAADASGETTE